MKKKFWKVFWKIFNVILTLVVAAGSLYCLMDPMVTLLTGTGITSQSEVGAPQSAGIVDRYNMYINNRVAGALDGVLAVKKLYWLNDQDIVAPEPNQSKFGTAVKSSDMGHFLMDAQEILGGQKTLFHTETPLMPGSKVNYYLDETIMAITWKQVLHEGVYTISEVKIAHPSQFRRFLSGGAYGSGIQLSTTHMAQIVNAVVASSGDFYAFRPLGVTVYEGVVRRGNDDSVDTCYIDDKGNMLFSFRGQFDSNDQIQQFVDANNIRFSMSFGPVLIQDGVAREIPSLYAIGEGTKKYSRAVLCQLDDLHYLVITVNREGVYRNVPNLKMLQDELMKFGVRHAYTLDGGQTAALVMNDKLINRVDWDEQRLISDIFYFATALPEHLNQ